MKETLNYADKDEEAKGKHIIEQKNEFEAQIFKYLEKFGDEICVDSDPVTSCMSILDEVKRLKEQGILPSSNLQKEYKGFTFKKRQQPLNTTKL